MLRKVSCLHCVFCTKSIEYDEVVYRCRAHTLRQVDVSAQILCSRFKRKGDTGQKKEESIAVKDLPEIDFDTGPLYSLIQRERKKSEAISELE